MSYQLFRNIKLVDENFNLIPGRSALVEKQGRIEWIGPQSQISKKLKVTKEIDLKGNLVFPSFVECHTHTVFGGSRADEFELRIQGVSYSEISKRGGGILSTMHATRGQSATELLRVSQKRVNQFLKQGVSTLEIKTGYALDLKNEIKCLKVINQLKGPQIISTYLGAHALPPEFSDHEDYLNFISHKVLPQIKKLKLSNRVDIFIEKGFFEAETSKSFLMAAQKLGFDLTLHANQLSLSDGAELALELQALSADHVIHLSDETIQKWPRSSTVAVLLPTADLYMKCPFPKARQLIEAGVDVALATDYNPGSCPSQDLALVGLLARLEMKMTLPEVFKAYTYGAAKALNLHHQQGKLQAGQLANFISTEASLSDFFYSAGFTPEHDLFIRGRRVNRTSL